jgi:hypothetical protein
MEKYGICVIKYTTNLVNSAETLKPHRISDIGFIISIFRLAYIL